MKIKREKKKKEVYNPVLINPYDPEYNGKFVSRDTKGIVTTVDNYNEELD